VGAVVPWLIVGLIAGGIANATVPGRTPGGTVGALIGGILGGWTFDPWGISRNLSSIGSLIVAIIGAVTILDFLQTLSKRNGRRRSV
jgi:uncharacterized membrane protein YeaQ/YmgE (transglycosylase-associated protein family)